MAGVPESQKVGNVPQTKFNAAFASKAEALLPELHTWTARPIETITFQSDPTSFFCLAKRSQYPIEGIETQAWGKGDEFILDFGDHLVGFLHLRLDPEGVNIDAPTRLRLTFGESPLDVTEDLHPSKSWISTSWLPDEIFNIDWLPANFSVPRRHAFRYVRVQILDTSIKYKVRLSEISVDAVSSVTAEQLDSVPPFPFKDDELLCKIDQVSQTTLRNCMQTVFEDGPRRDRRLWSGDLRLQALVNYCTFRNMDLVKRCLYLFASLVRDDGSLPACLFEKPVLRPASDYIVDYDALFGAMVRDYLIASGDQKTAEELWPTVLGSAGCALSHVKDGVFCCDETSAWKFLDWAEDLDKSAGMHGVTIVALKAVNGLAGLLGKPIPYENEVKQMVAQAVPHFYDAAKGVFRSGPQGQVSWASQAWMALAGVAEPEILKTALINTMQDPSAVKPLTPYLYHHVAEALCDVGGEAECLRLIKEYWGGMVRAGADTFWECYDPDDCRSSPYGDCHNNSYCHAWSCTPSYLLRVKLRNWLENKGGQDVI